MSEEASRVGFHLGAARLKPVTAFTRLRRVTRNPPRYFKIVAAPFFSTTFPSMSASYRPGRLELHGPLFFTVMVTPLSFALHWAISKRHMLLYVFPLEAQVGRLAIFGQGFWHTGVPGLHGPSFFTVRLPPLSFASHLAISKVHSFQ